MSTARPRTRPTTAHAAVVDATATETPPEPAQAVEPDTATWTLRWGDHRWTDDDLLVVHFLHIAEALGKDTFDVDPRRGPLRLVAVLAAFVAVAESKPLAAVLFQLSMIPMTKLVDAIEAS